MAAKSNSCISSCRKIRSMRPTLVPFTVFWDELTNKIKLPQTHIASIYLQNRMSSYFIGQRKIALKSGPQSNKPHVNREILNINLHPFGLFSIRMFSSSANETLIVKIQLKFSRYIRTYIYLKTDYILVLCHN